MSKLKNIIQEFSTFIEDDIDPHVTETLEQQIK